MAEKQYSAEKDLLKLIENPGEADAAGLRDVSETDTRKPLQKISFFSFRKKNREATQARTTGGGLLVWGRRQFLRGLLAVTLCVLAYFLWTVVREYSKTHNTKNLVKFTYISEGKEATVTSLGGKEVRIAPKTSEAEPSVVRNIFKAGAAKKEEQKKDESSAVATDYHLVGLSADTDPAEAYAMVKNVKTNITFFLKKGDRLDGMELASIQDNKVILKSKGQEVELR